MKFFDVFNNAPNNLKIIYWEILDENVFSLRTDKRHGHSF